MPPLPLEDLVGEGWAEALAPVEPRIRELGAFLRAERAAGRPFHPPAGRIFAAFAVPPERVKVLIVGQDPYPTPGHAMGLCFSAAPHVRPFPKSLQNIFREYVDDLGHPPPSTPDLSPWVDEGVMLLNRVLTVASGRPASHAGRGWEAVTEQAIDVLARRGAPLVALLWGGQARSLRSRLGGVPTIESPHPSPLSAHRGFLGSRPFSRANALLVEQGAAPVDWRLP